MPQIGWFEILIIVAISIIVIGPKDFPLVLKKIGSWIGSVKRYVSSIQQEVSNIGDDNAALHSNPKKWNNLKLENMKFPLIHPKIIFCDRKVDSFLTDEGFSIPNLSYRIKNKLKKLFS